MNKREWKHFVEEFVSAVKVGHVRHALLCLERVADSSDKDLIRLAQAVRAHKSFPSPV